MKTLLVYRQESDLYLFSNERTDTVFTGTVTVAAQGTPVLYDPMENKVYPLDYEETQQGTKLHLTVRPFELTVVVFNPGPVTLTSQPIEPSGQGISLGSWQVSLCKAKEYPAFGQAFSLEKLTNIGELYPDFSGFIRYETTFSSGGNCQTVLQLEHVYECAQVWCNGQYIGSRIAPRYLFDLTQAIQKGTNHLRIEVATTPERDALTKIDLSAFPPGFPTSRFIPSTLDPTGLLGEVRIYETHHSQP